MMQLTLRVAPDAPDTPSALYCPVGVEANQHCYHPLELLL